MNTATKRTYKKDLIAQFLYFPMIGLYLFGILSPEFIIFGLMLQFFVGVVQVLSGIIHIYYFDDSFHKKYLTGALSYLLFLYLASGITDDNWIIKIILFIIIPTGIATWYIYNTWKMYRSLNERYRGENYQHLLNENVLDDTMVYESSI